MLNLAATSIPLKMIKFQELVQRIGVYFKLCASKAHDHLILCSQSKCNWILHEPVSIVLQLIYCVDCS